MKIAELREAFRRWQAHRREMDAVIIMSFLADPTPITEAGLRELGFEQYFGTSVWWLGSVRIEIVDDSAFFDRREIKSMGQLRGLLLFVGE